MQKAHQTFVQRTVNVSTPVGAEDVAFWIETCDDVETLKSLRKRLSARIRKLEEPPESPDPYE